MHLSDRIREPLGREDYIKIHPDPVPSSAWLRATPAVFAPRGNDRTERRTALSGPHALFASGTRPPGDATAMS
jgi:hypothetical protein